MDSSINHIFFLENSLLNTEILGKPKNSPKWKIFLILFFILKCIHILASRFSQLLPFPLYLAAKIKQTKKPHK